MHGTVVAIHIKPETPGERGLPKQPVVRARITTTGLAGDFNRFRHEELHDDPDSAILLLPQETLDDLVREGWPVAPGHVGENLTTRGIPYAEFVSGRRFIVGTAELEVTRACTPCNNLYELPYVGKARGAEFMKTMIGRRGWYARVVREGDVVVGAPIDGPA